MARGRAAMTGMLVMVVVVVCLVAMVDGQPKRKKVKPPKKRVAVIVRELEKNVTALWGKVDMLSQPVHVHVHGDSHLMDPHDHHHHDHDDHHHHDHGYLVHHHDHHDHPCDPDDDPDQSSSSSEEEDDEENAEEEQDEANPGDRQEDSPNFQQDASVLNYGRRRMPPRQPRRYVDADGSNEDDDDSEDGHQHHKHGHKDHKHGHKQGHKCRRCRQHEKHEKEHKHGHESHDHDHEHEHKHGNKSHDHHDHHHDHHHHHGHKEHDHHKHHPEDHKHDHGHGKHEHDHDEHHHEDHEDVHHGGHGTHVHIHLHTGGMGEMRRHQDLPPAPPKEYRYAHCDVGLDSPARSANKIQGSVMLRQMPGDPLEIKVDLRGFPIDMRKDESVRYLRAMHAHQFGDDGDNCMRQGGHYNPHGVDHGGPTAKTRHPGDFGNLVLKKDGSLKTSFNDTRASLFGDFSLLGRGVVFHAGADDLGLKDDPASKRSGNAGSRVACCAVLACAKPAGVWP